MGDWTGESHSTPALDFRVQKVILFELVISIPLAIAHSAIRLAGEKVFSPLLRTTDPSVDSAIEATNKIYECLRKAQNKTAKEVKRKR